MGNKKTLSYLPLIGEGISKISGKRIAHLFKSPYEVDLGGGVGSGLKSTTFKH
jgi:hypothetical protein